jgi:hypothetical protein
MKQTTEEPEHRIMWEGGPARRFSETRTSLTSMPYANGGFVGNYVCGVCNEACGGVYAAKLPSRHAGMWICGACRNSEIAQNAKPRNPRSRARGGREA